MIPVAVFPLRSRRVLQTERPSGGNVPFAVGLWFKAYGMVLWLGFKTFSVYVVILAFAQAGANKFPVAAGLDVVAYFTVYLWEFRYLLNVVMKRGDAGGGGVAKLLKEWVKKKLDDTKTESIDQSGSS